MRRQKYGKRALSVLPAAALCALLFLSGCGSDAVPDPKDLVMTFEVLADEPDVGVLRVENRGDRIYCCGVECRTERETADDWEPVTGGEVPAEQNLLQCVFPGNSMERRLSLRPWGGLTPGQYRISLEFVKAAPYECGRDAANLDMVYQVYAPPGDMPRMTLTAEFMIPAGLAEQNEAVEAERRAGDAMARLTEAFRRDAGLDDDDRPWLRPEEYPPAYGGFYIDTDGEAVLLITEGHEASIDSFREITGRPDLRWRAVPHSYAELLTLQQTMLPYMGKPALGFDLRVVGVDDRGNCLRVTLASADDASAAAFRETVTDSDAVVIGEGKGLTIEE